MGKVKTTNYKNTEEYKRIRKAFPDKSEMEIFDIYEFDMGKIENDWVEAIEQKIESQKKAPEEKRSSLDKVRNLKAKKKKDDSKQKVIDYLFQAVKEADFLTLEQEMTGTKMSFMDIDGNYYSMTITKHKTAPDGYKGGM